jgi:hypothetical protein
MTIQELVSMMVQEPYKVSSGSTAHFGYRHRRVSSHIGFCFAARPACLDVRSPSLATYINDSRCSKAAAWRLPDG